MARLSFALFIAAVFPLPALGLTPFPYRSGSQLGIEFEHVGFPTEQLRKDLRSGFTTTVLFRVKVITAGETKSRDFIVTVFYDLWDEVYRMSRSSSVGRELSSYKSLDQVLVSLEGNRLTPIGLLSDLPKSGDVRVEISVFLDPIQKDRADVIRKWISENSVNTGFDRGKFNSLSVHGNPLFRSLLDTYLNEGLSTARWKTSAVSPPFNPASLAGERESPKP